MNCRMPLITAQIFLIVGVSCAVAAPQQVSVDKRALQEALSGGQFDVLERELNALAVKLDPELSVAYGALIRMAKGVGGGSQASEAMVLRSDTPHAPVWSGGVTSIACNRSGAGP